MHVRGFIDNMFHNADDSPQEEQTYYPMLPSGLSIEFVRKSSITGWMAYRMGEFLSWNQVARDSLFFSPFLGTEARQKNELLELSELVLQWHIAGENIAEKVKHKRLSPAVETACLNVYREYLEYLKIHESDQQNNTDASTNYKVVLTEVNDTSNVDRYMWKVYRDVMYAVTQRKFLLISEDEINAYTQGAALLQQEVKERSDITTCREKTKDIFQQLGLEPAKIMSCQLVISEAVTNILKHAEQGSMFVTESAEEIRVIIRDKGPGFAIKELPNTVLIAGYSTKKSLGQGFTLMMKMSDQVLLNTTPNGSTIILIFKKAGQNK